MNDSVINSSNLYSNDSVGWDCSFPVPHGIVLILINAVVCVSGTLGNILVCVAVATNPRLRRRPNYLLASLAIADLIVTMICIPLTIAVLFKRTFHYDCNTISLELPYLVLARLSCSSSFIHMAAISVDRLFAVVFPLRHKFIIGSCGLRTMVIASWFVPVSLIVLSRFVSLPFAGFGILGVNYIIVFLSYSLIMISLFRHRKTRNQITAGLPQSEAKYRVEARVAVTLGIVILVFTASWIPFFAIIFSTGKLLLKRYSAPYMWIRTLALSNSAMNVLIYGARMKNFSESFAGIFRKLCGPLTGTFSRTVTYRVNPTQ